jgi:hypothetical protein
MSYANLLTGTGVINPRYLPTGPGAPYLENPLQETVDGGGQTITNLDQLDVGFLSVGPGQGGSAESRISNSFTGTIPVSYRLWCAGETAGPLINGNLQLRSISNAIPGQFPDASLLNMTPQGNNIILGDSAVVGGCNVSVNGSLGLGRVYDSRYNPAPVNFNINPWPLVKDDTYNVTSALNGRITVIRYTTNAETGDATIFLPSPGVFNETYGLVFTNVGAANTDNVNILTDNAAPVTILTVQPGVASFQNKAYWFVNVAPDSYIWFN